MLVQENISSDDYVGKVKEQNTSASSEAATAAAAAAVADHAHKRVALTVVAEPVASAQGSDVTEAADGATVNQAVD